MPTGRPLPPLLLSDEAVSQLDSLAKSRSLPHALVQRAQIILECSGGGSNVEIGKRMGVTHVTVGKWRARYIEKGIAGLHDELRPGRPRSHDDEKVMELISLALETEPKDGSTHWTVRSLAEESGISKSTAHRWMQAFRIQPHGQKTFKLSTDAFFVEKVRDIVGLYLNPPDNALVLCVDEKTQIQALDRTQPLLPLGLGYL
jgi:putative transposase